MLLLLAQGLYNRILKQFNALYRRRAFLHAYCGEGLDDMQLTEVYIPSMLADKCSLWFRAKFVV